jgi:hypothetical protein
MTEKEMTKIAEMTAKLIIDHFEDKQDEYNEQFKDEIRALKDAGMEDLEITFLSEEQMLEIEIAEAEQRLKEAIDKEQYTKASEINKKIIKLKSKLK